jgi:hypothetical protein
LLTLDHLDPRLQQLGLDPQPDSRAPDIGFSVLPDLFGVCCS